MMKKVWTVITRNFGYKLLALIAAIIFWMIVVNVNDPNMTKTFTIEVTMENEDVITDMGKVYEVLDDSDTVSFTVTGARSVVENLAVSDFTATADLSQIEGMSLVPIEVTASKYANRIKIERLSQNVIVSVEDAKSSRFVITADYTGTPADGYAVGSMEVTPNVITITGAESKVDQIAKVVAAIDVSDMTSDINDRVTPIIYDEDGKVMDSSNLTFSKKKVDVSVKIENTKTVDISFESSGTTLAGYYVTLLTSTPDSVLVQGEQSALSKLDKVSIPADVVSVEGASDSVSVTVNISDYLPDGVSLVDKDQDRVVLTAWISAGEVKSYNVPISNFELVNVPEGLDISVSSTRVKVLLMGLGDVLSEISADDITGIIDASGADESTTKLQASISEYSWDVEVVDTSVVKVKVEPAQEESADEEDDTATDEDADAQEDGE